MPKVIVRRERREILQGVRGNPEGFPEAMKKATARTKETVEKILALLGAEQKTAARKMLGEPFEIKFEGRGGKPGGDKPPARTDF